MNFKNVRKYLSLILLVLAIFSISIGASVAAGENSSTDQVMVYKPMAVDNLHIYNVSYSNYYYSYTDYESISDSKNPLSKDDSIIDNNLSLFTKISPCNENDISNSKKNSSIIKNTHFSNENTVYNLSSNSYTSTVEINSNIENNLSKSPYNSLFNNLNLTTNHILTILCEENSNQMKKIYLNNILDHELIVFNNSNNDIMGYIFNKNDMDRNMVNVLLQFDKIFKQRPMNNDELFNFKNQYNGKYNEDYNEDFNGLTDLDNYSHKINMNGNFKEISNIGSFDKNLLDTFSTVDFSINKNLLYNKHQLIKNNNSLFYIFNNSKNNFKIFALSTHFIDDTSDEMDDDEEPSDSVYLANRLILYINFLNSTGLKYTYKILDNTNYSYLDSANSYNLSTTPILKTSFFNLLESYSFNTDYFIFENISFEIADIKNDSINFGIITDYFNLLSSNNHEFILNYINFNDLRFILDFSNFSFNTHGIIDDYNLDLL